MRAKKSYKKAAKRAAKKRARTKTKAATKKPVSKTAARAPRAAPPSLRALPVYEFTAGGLLGYVRLADPDMGVEFSRCLEGKSLPSTCKEVLSLRHYLARGQGGILAPREAATWNGKVDKKGVIFRYDKPPKWPVAATARYELLSEGGVDATFAFSFTKALRGFEAGIETLMPRVHSAVFVHAGGRWLPAGAGPRLKRFYPRNLGAAEFIADGRWNGLRMAGLGLAVEPQGYDYPMVVVWEANSGWALAYMALTEECSSVWVNGTERTVGLALVGADMKARSAVTCRLRVLLCQAAQLDDVLPHYRVFVQEARTTRKR